MGEVSWAGEGGEGGASSCSRGQHPPSAPSEGDLEVRTDKKGSTALQLRVSSIIPPFSNLRLRLPDGEFT